MGFPSPWPWGAPPQSFLFIPVKAGRQQGPPDLAQRFSGFTVYRNSTLSARSLKLGSHKGNMGLHLPQAPPALRIIISKPRVWKQFPQEGEAARRVP